MAPASAVLLGTEQTNKTKQNKILTTCVESNTGTINSLVSSGVKNTYYFNKFSQPRSTQGHCEREDNWCCLICKSTFSGRVGSSATWANCRGMRKIHHLTKPKLQKRGQFSLLSDLPLFSFFPPYAQALLTNF